MKTLADTKDGSDISALRKENKDLNEHLGTQRREWIRYIQHI
jgi:hypothetical protein